MTILNPQGPGIPVPGITPVSVPFWEGAKMGELMFQRCMACGAAVFNPAWMCRSCGGAELEWELSSGLGTIYSWTIAYTAPSKAFKIPYAPAIVNVEEGFQMISNIIGCNPEEIHAGQKVGAEFHKISEGIALPYFRPVPVSIQSQL